MVKTSASLALLAFSILFAAAYPAFMVCGVLLAIGLIFGKALS